MWVGVFFLSTVYISAWNGHPINYVFVFDSRRCLFVQFSRIAFWWARNVMPMCCIVLPVEVRCTTFWERFTGSSLGPITDRRFLQQTRTTTWHYRTAAFRSAAAGGSPRVHSSPRTLWIRSGTAGQTTAGTIWRTLAWWSSCSRLVQMKSFGWPLLTAYILSEESSENDVTLEGGTGLQTRDDVWRWGRGHCPCTVNVNFLTQIQKIRAALP